MQQYPSSFFPNFPGMGQIPIPQQQPQQPQPQIQPQQQPPMYQLPGNVFPRTVSPAVPAMPQQSVSPIRPEPTPLEEFEKLWTTVINNPDEFGYWEALVQYTSRIDDIRLVKEAYDKFLEEYPLCYVYWKNYAERVEELTKDFEEARKIYERSTGPLRYSEANWYNYVSFCGDRALKALESLNVFQTPSSSSSSTTVTANGSELSTSKLSSIARETFEKAIDAVGIDFSAQEIWSKYIDFEVASCDFKRVVDLFDRALSIPMNNLENVWNKYRIYAQGRPLEDVLTTEELSAHKAKVASAAAEGPDVAKRLEIETIKSVIDKRELIYKKTLAEVEKRMAYEKIALNRSYFHVMPMSPDSLANWRAYLRWEEQQEKSSESVPGAGKRTVQLYERCLIPCCACQEFWFMYVDYLQRHGEEDSVKRVFDRAAKVYFKNVPSFFLKYALFEEANSRTYKADDIYSTLLARVPGHIEATLKYAAFLRRRGDEGKCRDVLEKGVASVPQGNPRQKALLMIHLAKFFEQTEKTSLARSTYSELTRLCNSVLEGWMCAIEFEVNEIRLRASAEEREKIEARINALFHNALLESCGLSMADKKKLWVSWTEISADCGFSIKTISAVEADYSIVLSGSFPDWTHTDSEFPLDPNAQENGGAPRAPIEEELLPPGKKQKIVGDAK